MMKLFESPAINSKENHSWEIYPHSELHATNDKKDKSSGIELMDLTSKVALRDIGQYIKVCLLII